MRHFLLLTLFFSCACLSTWAQSNIRLIEYSWDTDLGHGRNTLIPVSQTSGDFNLNLSIQNLSPGYHLLFLRSRDVNRLWSHTHTHLVNVQTGANPARITRLDYTYYQASNLIGQYSYSLPTPSTTVDIRLPGNTSQLVNGQTYLLSIWATDENGTRSQVYTKSFTRLASACETVRTGSWNDIGIWTCGRVPLVSDEAIINPGHTVTVPAGLFQIQQITYRGGNVRFNAGGRLLIKTN